MPNGKDGPGTTPGQCVLPGPWVSAGMGLGCRAEPVARFPVFQQAPSGREAVLQQDPFSGPLFVFRGRPGDLVKVIWWDGQGACMFLNHLHSYYTCFLSSRQFWPGSLQRMFGDPVFEAVPSAALLLGQV